MEIIPYFLYRLIRRFTAPIEKIIELIPDEANILDLGCGRGIITEEVYKRKHKTYIGADIDKNRIESLKKKFPSFQFIAQDALSLVKDYYINKKKFDCIIISDLLYLIERSLVEELLCKTYNLLSENGIIIIKDVDGEKINPLVYLQEYLSVKLFKFTAGMYFSFKSINLLQQIFSKNNINYTIIDAQRLWYPHFIVVIRK